MRHLLTLTLLATALHAMPIITQGGTFVAGQGMYTNAVGAVTVDFNNNAAPASGLVTYSLAKGSIVEGTQVGAHVSPVNDSSRYLSVDPTREAIITFGAQMSYFGFYTSSIDCSDTIKLMENNVVVLSLSGSQLEQIVGSNKGNGVYININALKPADYFNKVVISSNNYSFETDNHAFAAATPEPGTLLLIGTGLGTLAYFRGRRRVVSGEQHVNREASWTEE